jgi:predicted tellurium resistance membrane protein TerC
MIETLVDPQVSASFFTLSVLEIVLGIDNLVFISLLAGRLPRQQQARARRIGLTLALVMRLALLGSIAWLVHLILIGMMLVADRFGVHVPRGYVYAAMGFSGLIEALNLLATRRGKRHREVQ